MIKRQVLKRIGLPIVSSRDANDDLTHNLKGFRRRTGSLSSLPDKIDGNGDAFPRSNFGHGTEHKLVLPVRGKATGVRGQVCARFVLAPEKGRDVTGAEGTVKVFLPGRYDAYPGNSRGGKSPHCSGLDHQCCSENISRLNISD